jgi:hypothetical protein
MIARIERLVLWTAGLERPRGFYIRRARCAGFAAIRGAAQRAPVLDFRGVGLELVEPPATAERDRTAVGRTRAPPMLSPFSVPSPWASRWHARRKHLASQGDADTTPSGEYGHPTDQLLRRTVPACTRRFSLELESRPPGDPELTFVVFMRAYADDAFRGRGPARIATRARRYARAAGYR